MEKSNNQIKDNKVVCPAGVLRGVINQVTKILHLG